MRVNPNIAALAAYKAYSATQATFGKMGPRLSTGQRVNAAADDAAGLALSEKIRAQLRGLDQASRNAQDGISMIQTAEGALLGISSVMQRVRELSVRAASGVLTVADRASLQAEIDQLRAEIDRIASTAQFNKKNLLDGSATAPQSGDQPSTEAQAQKSGVTRGAEEVPAETDANEKGDFQIFFADMRASALGLDDLRVASRETAERALPTIDHAIGRVSRLRAMLGAYQNRLEHTVSNLTAAASNTVSSESRIHDADTAKGMMDFAKLNIIQQSGASMMAQTNQQPQAVLSLLQK